MATPDVKVSYHDLSSLQKLRSQVKTDEAGAIKQAAQQFESVFMGMLLTSMRNANKAFEEDNPLKSNATDFFRDMHDNQLSAELSKNGALGLADLMVQQLKPELSKTKAASTVSMPSRFDQVKPRELLLANDQQMFALPDHKTHKFQLDPERVVSPIATKGSDLTMPQPSLVPIKGAPEALQVSAVTDTSKLRQLGDEIEIFAPKQMSVQAQAGIGKIMTRSELPALDAVGFTAATTQNVDALETAKQLATDDEPTAFIQRLLPAATQAAKQLGLEPLALIAQAALETGWGQRMFKTSAGVDSHNLFGIKATGNWQGDVAVVDTLEYRQGVAQKEKARFRAYESPEHSLQDYVALIQQNPRYQAALDVASDTKSYFRQLQAAGYATDPNYAEKIVSVLEGKAFKQVRNLLGN
jgi:flagellar protein FlgJ